MGATSRATKEFLPCKLGSGENGNKETNPKFCTAVTDCHLSPSPELSASLDLYCKVDIQRNGARSTCWIHLGHLCSNFFFLLNRTGLYQTRKYILFQCTIHLAATLVAQGEVKKVSLWRARKIFSNELVEGHLNSDLLKSNKCPCPQILIG